MFGKVTSIKTDYSTWFVDKLFFSSICHSFFYLQYDWIDCHKIKSYYFFFSIVSPYPCTP